MSTRRRDRPEATEGVPESNHSNEGVPESMNRLRGHPHSQGRTNLPLIAAIGSARE